MGFLKGQWSSLQGLCIRINNEDNLRFASLWVTACIHLHTFAIDHEDAQFVTKDKFYKVGRNIIRKERRELSEWNVAREEEPLQLEQEREEEIELLEGKLKCEILIKELFAHLDRQ